MVRFAGKCIGGPHDGRTLAYTTQTYHVRFFDWDTTLVEQMIGLRTNEDMPSIGWATYLFEPNDEPGGMRGVWRWQPKN